MTKKIIPIHTSSSIYEQSLSIVPDYRSIELIIKPTKLCNFKCTFCSSTDIVDDDTKTLELNRVFDFLCRYPNTNTIIVNGGDPLMMTPDYYWKIIEFLDNNNLKSTISFTSNLWAFYKKPSMWEELFKHERMGIATSFNYGDTRRVTETKVYTEDLFWKVSDLFLERIGYRPGFISVITDENEDTALKNVELAQRMDVECKLNYAMVSGVQSSPYQLSKIYKVYVDIYNKGLWPWEYNTKQMMHRLNGKSNSCPQSRNCDDHIRCLQPSGDYYSCGAMGDDRLFPIDFNQEVINSNFQRPLQTAPDVSYLKDECTMCPMFQICNGCKKTVMDMKQHGMVETHCLMMKQLTPMIIDINEKSETVHCDTYKLIADTVKVPT